MSTTLRRPLAALAVTASFAGLGSLAAAPSYAAGGNTMAAAGDTAAPTAAVTVTTDSATNVYDGSAAITATAGFGFTGLPAGAACLVNWDVNGQSTRYSCDSVSTLTHAYKAVGNHRVSVTVWDKAGNQKAFGYQYLAVHAPAAQAPVAGTAFVATANVLPGSRTVRVTASGGSVATALGAQLQYKVNFNDPAQNASVNAVVGVTPTDLQFTYTGPGTYDVQVWVTDGADVAKDQVIHLPVTITAAPAGQAQAVVSRDAGASRYATGIALSKKQFAADHSAPAVVIATGANFPDALAGVPLAAKKGGPLLLVPPTLDGPDGQAVLAEVSRVLAPGGTVFVLGLQGAVKDDVAGTLAGGRSLVRLGGPDRYATALAIAEDPRAMADPQHVIVTTGTGYADALAAGPYAAGPFALGREQAAIVLSHDAVLDGDTRAYVAGKLAAGGPNVAAVGGHAVSAVGAMAGSDGFGKLWGQDRYATSAAVAAKFPAGDPVGVAIGSNFPDALTGGGYMAGVGGPILMTDPTTLSTPTGTALVAVATSVPTVDLFGGPAALPDSVGDQIVTAIHGLRRF